MGLPKSIDYAQCIYGLKGPDGMIKYIGHARYAAERLALHKLRARKGTHDHLPVYQWMHQIGPENVTVEIIEKFNESVPLETVCEREIFWIKEYRSCSEMTNLSDGGFQSHLPSMLRGDKHPLFGKPMRESHKEALVKGRIEAWESKTEEEKAEYIRKMSETNKAAWDNMDPETREKHRVKANRGQQMWLATEDPEVIKFKMSRGPHVRSHVKTEKPNAECVHCINENLV